MASNRYFRHAYINYGKREGDTQNAVLVELAFANKQWKFVAYTVEMKVSGPMEGLVKSRIFNNGYCEKVLFEAARYTAKGYERALDAFTKDAEAFVKEQFAPLFEAA